MSMWAMINKLKKENAELRAQLGLPEPEREKKKKAKKTKILNQKASADDFLKSLKD